MANFQGWIAEGTRRHRKLRDGSYQNLYNDSGNWSTGKIGQGTLIGTNRSIAAPTLIAWRGEMVTAQDMKNLSRAEATQIYKAKFWDRVMGDGINSQLVANLAADMRSSGGYNGIKPLQRALNTLGNNLGTDGQVGDLTLAAINDTLKRKGERTVYEEYRKELIKWYSGANPDFRDAWIRKLNEDYPPYDELDEDRKGDTGGIKSWVIWAIIIVLVAVAITTVLYVNL